MSDGRKFDIYSVHIYAFDAADNSSGMYSTGSFGPEYYIDFISNCPFPNCKNNKKTIRWTHEYCGGRLKLSTEGCIRCLKCQEIKLFTNWDINCGNHHSISELHTQDCVEWLRTFANFAKSPEENRLIAKITMNIMMQLS